MFNYAVKETRMTTSIRSENSWNDKRKSELYKRCLVDK